MLLQYHCSCCNKVVASNEKVCQSCGSQHIRTPFSMWVFCIAACLIAAIVFNVVRVYSSAKESSSSTPILLEILQKSNK